jgi:hypothetical protein
LTATLDESWGDDEDAPDTAPEDEDDDDVNSVDAEREFWARLKKDAIQARQPGEDLE